MKNQHIFRFNSSILKNRVAATLALPQSLVRKTASIFSLLICVVTAAFGQVGTFDATFGSAGAYTFPIPQGADFVSGNNLIVLPNDQILVQTADQYQPFFAKGKLHRLTAGGTPDASFGMGGTTLIQDSIYSSSMDFLVMPNGKIASFWHENPQSPIMINNIPFIRMHNADGSIATNFGANGRVAVPYSPSGGIVEGKIVTDGSNLYILYPYNGAQTIRSYTSTGAVNNAFGNSGVLVLSNSDEAQIVYTPTAGGRLLFIVPTASGMQIKRLLLSGLTDFSYGSAGIVTVLKTSFTADCGVFSAELQNDGKLIVHGYEFGATQILIRVVRIDANGMVDAAFGNNAQIPQNATNGSFFVGNDIVQQPDGKILLAGLNIDTATENSQKAFFRLNSDGTFDSGFGINGLLSLGAFGTETLAEVALQSTGKIIGLVDGGNSGTAAYVIRLLNNLNVGVLQNSKLTELGLYPNPIVSQFELSYELGSSAAISINLVDAQGRTVHSFQTQQKEDGKQVHSFSLPSTVAAGFYTLVIQSDNGSSNNLQILVKR